MPSRRAAAWRPGRGRPGLPPCSVVGRRVVERVDGDGAAEAAESTFDGAGAKPSSWMELRAKSWMEQRAKPWMERLAKPWTERRAIPWMERRAKPWMERRAKPWTERRRAKPSSWMTPRRRAKPWMALRAKPGVELRAKPWMERRAISLRAPRAAASAQVRLAEPPARQCYLPGRCAAQRRGGVEPHPRVPSRAVLQLSCTDADSKHPTGTRTPINPIRMIRPATARSLRENKPAHANTPTGARPHTNPG